jgi:phosphate transport system permease protein
MRGQAGSLSVSERTARSLRGRRLRNRIMVGLTFAAALVATLPLLMILAHLIREGAGSLTPSFFTQTPRPPGETGGGMANAIVGTLIIVGMASGIGLPIGMGAGLYLAEHKTTRLATLVRFLADVLNGLPSIVVGIVAWGFFVRPFGAFSAWSAGIALGVMMIPLVTRTTEEMIRLVPTSLREAALALGYPRWRTSLAIVLRTALPGIVTGALVAVARIAGETAPLLFTTLGNSFLTTDLRDQMSALPLQVYVFATGASDEWNAQAWAGALVLIFIVLVISVAARFSTRSRFGHGAGD